MYLLMVTSCRWQTCPVRLMVTYLWGFSRLDNPHTPVPPPWLCERLEFKGRVSCARVGLPFPFPILPRQPPLPPFQPTEPGWRDAPQRSWPWISFGLTPWKGQRRAPQNGSEAFTPPSQGLGSLHRPEMARRLSRSGAPSQWNNLGPEGPLTGFCSVQWEREVLLL